jgi:hypothetical protein
LVFVPNISPEIPAAILKPSQYRVKEGPCPGISMLSELLSLIDSVGFEPVSLSDLREAVPLGFPWSSNFFP